MTVAIGWIRRIHDCEELVLCADSRLSGRARTFDYCAKLLTLPRSDCAIAFAGSTDNAYPMLHQLALAIESFGPLREGAMDIRSVRSHALKIFDDMASSIASQFDSERMPDDFSFIFGGYSWIEKRFCLWKIRYSTIFKRFIAEDAPALATNRQAGKVFFAGDKVLERSSSRSIGQICFAGDQGSEASHRLRAMLTERYQKNPGLFETGHLNFEPFEVICTMLRDPSKAHTIGGAPQLLKVYQHMNTQSFGVRWPSANGSKIFLQGRPLLGYENVDIWVMDPDILKTTQFARLRIRSEVGASSHAPVQPQQVSDTPQVSSVLTAWFAQ